MKMTKSENCGPGCDCGKPSGNTKAKAVVCLIVLLAIGSIFAYKAMNEEPASPVVTAAAFAAPAAIGGSEQKPAAAQPNDEQKTTVNAVEEKRPVGELLDSLAALNTVAVNQDAVFVFLPANGSDLVSKETTDAIASAKKKTKSIGAKIGLYTLKSDSPEYANIAAQLPLPGMLVMSKDKGMGAVTGGITEEKILQAYVASSRAGGCGPSSSCGPSTPGCGPSAPSCK